MDDSSGPMPFKFENVGLIGGGFTVLKVIDHVNLKKSQKQIEYKKLKISGGTRAGIEPGKLAPIASHRHDAFFKV